MSTVGFDQGHGLAHQGGEKRHYGDPDYYHYNNNLNLKT